jgi:hypothetical protein
LVLANALRENGSQSGEADGPYQNGIVFTLNVQAKKGTLSVCGRKGKNDQSFSKVLGCIVD